MTTGAAAALAGLLPIQSAESDLVSRCCHGEEAAFETLYRRHVPALYRICCSLLGSASEAEDAVQVVFTRAFKSIHRFDGRSRLSTWLYAIAVGEATNIRRTWRRQRRLKAAMDTHLATLAPAPGPERSARSRRALQLVEQAVQRLPRQQRVAFLLQHGSGLSLTEVAEVMGASVQTTLARIKAAKQKILKMMPEGHEWGP